jgi:hypothetical protein
MSIDLKTASVAQLLDRFIELSIEICQIYHGSTRLYRRRNQECEKVVDEMDARELDLTELFAPLLRHEQPWVRYSAVRFCFDDMPEESKALLRELSEIPYHTLAPKASIVLDHYEQGYRHKKRGLARVRES